MPTQNSSETNNSSFPDPQYPKKEELWDSKASSPKVPVQVDSVEEIVEALEVVLAEASEAAIVADSEVAIVVDSEAVIVGVLVVDPVEDSVDSDPAIN